MSATATASPERSAPPASPEKAAPTVVPDRPKLTTDQKNVTTAARTWGGKGLPLEAFKTIATATPEPTTPVITMHSEVVGNDLTGDALVAAEARSAAEALVKEAPQQAAELTDDPDISAALARMKSDEQRQAQGDHVLLQEDQKDTLQANIIKEAEDKRAAAAKEAEAKVNADIQSASPFTPDALQGALASSQNRILNTEPAGTYFPDAESKAAHAPGLAEADAIKADSTKTIAAETSAVNPSVPAEQHTPETPSSPTPAVAEAATPLPVENPVALPQPNEAPPLLAPTPVDNEAYIKQHEATIDNTVDKQLRWEAQQAQTPQVEPVVHNPTPEQTLDVPGVEPVILGADGLPVQSPPNPDAKPDIASIRSATENLMGNPDVIPNGAQTPVEIPPPPPLMTEEAVKALHGVPFSPEASPLPTPSNEAGVDKKFTVPLSSNPDLDSFLQDARVAGENANSKADFQHVMADEPSPITEALTLQSTSESPPPPPLMTEEQLRAIRNAPAETPRGQNILQVDEPSERILSDDEMQELLDAQLERNGPKKPQQNEAQPDANVPGWVRPGEKYIPPESEDGGLNTAYENEQLRLQQEAQSRGLRGLVNRITRRGRNQPATSPSFNPDALPLRQNNAARESVLRPPSEPVSETEATPVAKKPWDRNSDEVYQEDFLAPLDALAAENAQKLSANEITAEEERDMMKNKEAELARQLVDRNPRAAEALAPRYNEIRIALEAKKADNKVKEELRLADEKRDAELAWDRQLATNPDKVRRAARGDEKDPTAIDARATIERAQERFRAQRQKDRDAAGEAAGRSATPEEFATKLEQADERFAEARKAAEVRRENAANTPEQAAEGKYTPSNDTIQAEVQARLNADGDFLDLKKKIWNDQFENDPSVRDLVNEVAQQEFKADEKFSTMINSYEESAKRIYDAPDKDPLYDLYLNQTITQERDGLDKRLTPEQKQRLIEGRESKIREHAVANFVKNHPEKAMKYASQDVQIQAAVDTLMSQTGPLVGVEDAASDFILKERARRAAAPVERPVAGAPIPVRPSAEATPIPTGSERPLNRDEGRPIPIRPTAETATTTTSQEESARITGILEASSLPDAVKQDLIARVAEVNNDTELPEKTKHSILSILALVLGSLAVGAIQGTVKSAAGAVAA